MPTAIAVENLSKAYRLGTIGTGSFLRDFERWFARVRGRPDPLAHLGETAHANRDEAQIWALHELSFEVQQGSVLGIIGRNGAGKSTLLKILSRVTAPTSGQIKIRGRIASLLEVGTGFHPELTGRENIYLNGAILGMTRAEVQRKFAEIVDFAGVERFIDTPVKRYSSGMYVRLAFAVAAHLEPEILIVDEVLAVGDGAFQQKCLGKLDEVAKAGRTVLLVSHNLGAIRRLCPEALLLDAGRAIQFGAVETVIGHYVQAMTTVPALVRYNPAQTPDAPVVLRGAWLGDQTGLPTGEVRVLDGFSVGLELLVRRSVPGLEISVRLATAEDQPLFLSNLSQSPVLQAQLKPGIHHLLVQVPPVLVPDRYLIAIFMHRPGVGMIATHNPVLSFTVHETGSPQWQYQARSAGNLLIATHWDAASPVVVEAWQTREGVN